MTRKQIDRLIRLKNTYQVMMRHRELWSGKPAIENSVNDLEVEITFLDFVHTAQSVGSVPTTKGKQAYLEQVHTEVLLLAGSLSTYAHDVGDEQLRTLADLSPYMLLRKREEAFLKIFQVLLNKAKEIGVETLTDYGIDEVKLSAFIEMYETTDVTIRLPQLTIGEIKALGAQVTSRFRHARFILMRQLRNLLATFRKTQPQFWLEFQAGLRILDTGSRKQAVVETQNVS